MRTVRLNFAMTSFALATAIAASSVTSLAQAPVKGNMATHPDGGVRQVLESIFIPPKPNAPFTLTLGTEWTRPLGNSGTYTLVNERHIARDSAGRVYEERWYLVPKNGKVESTMNYIQIADPAQHTLYNCQVELKKCFLQEYAGLTTTNYRPPVGVFCTAAKRQRLPHPRRAWQERPVWFRHDRLPREHHGQSRGLRQRSTDGDHSRVLVLATAGHQPGLQSRQPIRRKTDVHSNRHQCRRTRPAALHLTHWI